MCVQHPIHSVCHTDTKGCNPARTSVHRREYPVWLEVGIEWNSQGSGLWERLQAKTLQLQTKNRKAISHYGSLILLTVALTPVSLQELSCNPAHAFSCHGAVQEGRMLQRTWGNVGPLGAGSLFLFENADTHMHTHTVKKKPLSRRTGQVMGNSNKSNLKIRTQQSSWPWQWSDPSLDAFRSKSNPRFLYQHCLSVKINVLAYLT